MSDTVKRLPSVEELKKQIEDSPSIIEYYAKFDNYIGDIKSINYIIEKINSYYDDSKKN